MGKLKWITAAAVLCLFTFGMTMSANMIHHHSAGSAASISRTLGTQTHVASGPVNVPAIKNTGFNVVRDDIQWYRVEKSKNQYDYTSSGYDDYNKRLLKSGIRPYYILDYSNPLYEKNQSIVTEEGRQAFAKFVAKTVSRYKGEHAIWEIWNEPNLQLFWNPQTGSAEQYTKLVKTVAKVIRQNDPTGTVVAPAMSGLHAGSFDWIETTFKNGLLKEIDAVSVHPYRGDAPESVINDYQAFRKLIRQYTHKNIPIISGEWGYATNTNGFSPLQQARYLTRMFLINDYQKVPISIWYDWKNDGTDPANPEHNYGVIDSTQTTLKASGRAAQTLSKTLQGYHFSKRLAIGNDNDYLFKYVGSHGKTVYVFWTASSTEHTFKWPVRTKQKGQLISMEGEKLGQANTGTTTFKLSGSPTYLVVGK